MRALDPQAWRGYRKADFPAESWAVEGDTLRALPAGPKVSLVTREPVADFTLEFEWRLAPGGNSGVLYRVSEAFQAPWRSGPEMQLLDDAAHPDGRVPETSCGALYGLYSPRGAVACASGAYHRGRILVRGTRVEHWLNDVRVVDCDLASPEFRARVARSKFRDYPQFALGTEGHIVLQHHGSEAWFRKLRLETH